jgi:hypothetical protein
MNSNSNFIAFDGISAGVYLLELSDGYKTDIIKIVLVQ